MSARRLIGFGASAILAATLFLAGSGSADPTVAGGELDSGPASVVDNNTGREYAFQLRASEDENVAGRGSVALALNGPAVSLCTVRGPQLDIDFSTSPESGIFPFRPVQCGRAFGQTVSVDGCLATIKAHGFIHSDDPNSNVLDGMTVSVRFQKTGAASAHFDATITTTAKKVEAHGKATSGAPILMPTCP